MNALSMFISNTNSNLFSTVCKGSILELYSPRGWLVCFLVFQLSVALGTLAFSLSSPYEGLIGASPGGYGLFGGCVALALVSLCFSSGLKIDAACKFVLPPTLLVHAVLEVAMYIVSYQDEVGYVSHWAGALTGLVSGLLVLGMQTQASLELRGLAVFCALLLVLAIVLGTYVRYTHWPPVRLFYVGSPDASCCKGYLTYLHDMPHSSGSPTDLGYCQNSQFVPYHAT
ncbi:rhomboid family intramembrane serine protease [archaeon]|nr:MAG: rhomboid family intramembrane serine protease [archaeon]